ncbi:hypothetical protein ACP4OV_020865 [Aristida adscensionis]
MAASLWLQLPPPLHSRSHPCLAPPGSHSSSACPPLHHKRPQQARGGLLLRSSSGASSSPVVTKEQAAEEGSGPAVLSFRDDPNFRGCKGCGRAQVERGCNGEGRMQGGIAAVPGFGWWPIKAYRPCPGFVASGGRYRRYGQSMDDVASGRGKKVSSGKKKRQIIQHKELQHWVLMMR